MTGISGLFMFSTAGCLTAPRRDLQFTDWLYSPTVDSDLEHYQAYWSDYVVYREHDSFLPENIVSIVRDRTERVLYPLNVEFEEVHSAITTSIGYVYEVDGSRKSLSAPLVESDGFERKDDVEGFRLFYDDYRSYAVGDRYVFASGSPSISPDTLRYVLKAQAGRAPRYTDVSPDLARLYELVGDGTHISLRPRKKAASTEIEPRGNSEARFKHEVGDAYSFKIDGETTRWRWVELFDTAEHVDLDLIREWTERREPGQTFHEYEDVAVSQEGRAAIVTGTIATEDIYSY